MPIDPSLLSIIRAWSVDDLTLAIKTFQRAHPDTSGQPVADLSPAGVIEARVLDILSQTLNAQLAATPLIPANQQDMADRLNTLWASTNVSGWTSATPPPVSPGNFFLGDMLESLDAPRLPALIVTESLPNGVDVGAGAVGSMSQENTTVYALYVLPYRAGREVHLEALRGAGAIANILRTRRQDSVTLWVDGKVTHVTRNVPRLGDAPRFIVGLVTFTCTAFLPYTPHQG